MQYEQEEYTQQRVYTSKCLDFFDVECSKQEIKKGSWR